MKYERQKERGEKDKEKWGGREGGRTEGAQRKKEAGEKKKRKRGGEASGGLDPSGAKSCDNWLEGCRSPPARPLTVLPPPPPPSPVKAGATPRYVLQIVSIIPVSTHIDKKTENKQCTEEQKNKLLFSVHISTGRGVVKQVIPSSQ